MIKKGFTIAETLITLTIIGILATILIPALNNQKINSHIVMVKKAHKIVEEATAIMANDRELYRTKDSAKVFADLTQGTMNGKTYTGPDKYKKAFKDIVNIDTRPESKNKLPNGYDYMTTDGIAWHITNSLLLGGERYIVINADINGKEPPNSFSGDRPDIVGFTVFENGSIRAWGSDEIHDYVYGSRITND